MSAIMRRRLLLHGKGCGCQPSLNGKAQIVNSRGATDGNGHRVRITPIPVTGEQPARSENIMANSWLIRWSFGEHRPLRHRATAGRATATFFILLYGGNTLASDWLYSHFDYVYPAFECRQIIQVNVLFIHSPAEGASLNLSNCYQAAWGIFQASPPDLPGIR